MKNFLYQFTVLFSDTLALFVAAVLATLLVGVAWKMPEKN